MKKLMIVVAAFALSLSSQAGFERGNIMMDVKESFQLGDRILQSGDSIQANLQEVKRGNRYYELSDNAGNTALYKKGATLMHEDIARHLPIDRGVKVEILSERVVDTVSEEQSVLRGGCEQNVVVTFDTVELSGQITKRGEVLATFNGETTRASSRTQRSQCAGR